jgi:hypothetical protein
VLASTGRVLRCAGVDEKTCVEAAAHRRYGLTLAQSITQRERSRSWLHVAGKCLETYSADMLHVVGDDTAIWERFGGVCGQLAGLLMNNGSIIRCTVAEDSYSGLPCALIRRT